MQSGEHHRLRGELPDGHKIASRWEVFREIRFKSVDGVSVGLLAGIVEVLLVASYAIQNLSST